MKYNKKKKKLKNPFFIVELESDEEAKRLIRRSILIKYRINNYKFNIILNYSKRFTYNNYF